MAFINGNRKGQYFSFDAIIASVIFILTLVMLLSYWHSVRAYLDYQANDLSKEAVRLSNQIFSAPSGDCATGFKKFGLAISSSDKRMNETLLTCASTKLKDDMELKKALGAAYNVSIVVTDRYSIVPTNPKRYTLGSLDITDPKSLSKPVEISHIRRVATLVNSTGGEHIATVDLYVYR